MEFWLRMLPRFVVEEEDLLLMPMLIQMAAPERWTRRPVHGSVTWLAGAVQLAVLVRPQGLGIPMPRALKQWEQKEALTI